MAHPTPNITGLTSLFQYANTETNGIFGIGILFVLFFIVYVNLSFGDNTKAFAAATWVTAITAILLRLAGIVGDLVMYICFVLVVVGIISLRGQERDY